MLDAHIAESRAYHAEPVFDVAPVAFCAVLFLATVPKALRDRWFRLHRDDWARVA